VRQEQGIRNSKLTSDCAEPVDDSGSLWKAMEKSEKNWPRICTDQRGSREMIVRIGRTCGNRLRFDIFLLT